MTNVEYIDYFEKIIANEPENILSLYFVQKLMSDVRFRSFQPMISAELQKKILKMVLPKLKNQFKINRLVDFNPIGVADEEIEILNKESVTDVGTFVKTLDDGKVCKEIENLQIDKVSFYCLRVVYAVIENFGFLTANILTVILPTAFSDYGIWMAAIIFVFVGITFIFSNGMQTSPVFMVYGYKTYKCDDGYIITRLSREKINILMEDEQDGIEAREIVKGVYVTFPK